MPSFIIIPLRVHLRSQEFGKNDDSGRIKRRFLALAGFQVGKSDTKESILIKKNQWENTGKQSDTVQRTIANSCGSAGVKNCGIREQEDA